MKKQFTLFILIAAEMSLFLACNSHKTADEYMQNENQRIEIYYGIEHHQLYMREMMQGAMTNDSCKQIIAETMMNDPGMMSMMMDNMINLCSTDSSACKMMMGKTMGMCDADQSKCNMMMGSMKSHPNVMKSMKGMCGMDNMK